MSMNQENSVHERTSRFFEGIRPERRQIVTPEGVPIPVELADHGERLTAFVLDLCIWLMLTLAIYIPIYSLIQYTGSSLIAISIGLFIGFLVRNLYFVYFELAWNGATPGKRIVGLRVIDRNGGPLYPSAVVARNLTREVESFIPLGALMTGGLSSQAAIDWENLAIGAWLLFLSGLPLITRNRMRGGDLIAGTVVIRLPKRMLAGDLVGYTRKYTFSQAQLRAYGAFELQVLEELLRHPGRAGADRVFAEVREKICRRIGWPGPLPPEETLVFLRDFYTAQRAFLEREQLFGKARADKHALPAPPVDPKPE
jgi:uncharacterized RDD family membrane protein YckC